MPLGCVDIDLNVNMNATLDVVVDVATDGVIAALAKAALTR